MTGFQITRQAVETVSGSVAAPHAVPRLLLVTAENWMGFARFPRLLKMVDVDITAMCPAESMVAATRFVDRVIPAEGGTDAVCAMLLEHLAASPGAYDWCIIGDDDLFCKVAASGNPIVDSWFPIDRGEASREFFSSKYVFMKRCAEEHLPIAPFELCTTLAEAEAVAERFGYPVVAKARTSIGASGVIACADAAELAKAFAKFSPPVAVQRFVTGRAFATEVIFDHGVPVFWTSSEQINRWPRHMGPSSARRFLDVPAMGQILKTFGAFTKYNGVGAIDAVLPDDGGPPMLCEINPRPTPGFFVDRAAMQTFAQAILGIATKKSTAFAKTRLPENRVVAMFPESLYYFIDAPTAEGRLAAAIGSLRHIPIDDRKLLKKVLGNYARHAATKLRLRHNLKKLIGKA